jgi:large subunit ribosomal protein L11
VAKELLNKVKLQIPAGKATAAPPVGTALGPFGIALPEFCTRFNDATKDKMGDIVPVEVYIYDDRSFDFKVKTSPAAFLIKKAAHVQKASATGSKDIAGSITRDQLREIAETKMEDLNAYDIDAAMKIIEGTAKNMGIEIKD